MESLNAVQSLLEGFDRYNIIYCHWKSNEHVAEGIRGETDLDILISRHQALKVQALMAECGYKRFNPPVSQQYFGIEDYIAMDKHYGVLSHCHLHYQLTAGEKHLKGYRIPWEKRILEGRIWDNSKGIYIADPHIELLLLIVRSSLKIRFRDYLFALLGKKYFTGNDLVEFNWLKYRIDSDNVVNLSSELLGNKTANRLSKIIPGTPTFIQLCLLRHAVMKKLKLHKAYGIIKASVLKVIRELFWLIRGINKRYLHFSVPSGRTIPSGGCVVAFIGCDGSGKSTVIHEVQKCLCTKLHPLKIYFGSGDGPSSFLRWPMKIIARRLCRTAKSEIDRSNGKIPESSKIAHNSKVFQWLKSIARWPWALVLAREKQKKMRLAQRARNKGMIVLCDRYPQNQIIGFNDGPLLVPFCNHRFYLIKWLARYESKCYDLANSLAPDVVIRLNVSAEKSLERKSDMWLEEVQRRIEAINSFLFPSSTKVVDINADEPLEKVLLQAKLAIWEQI